MFFREAVVSGIIIFALILFGFAGCSLFMTDSEWIYSPMHPYSIRNIESGGARTPIVFRISSSLNTPCNEFSHSDIHQDYLNISVRFYQRYESGVRCTQEGVDTVITWRYIPLSVGEYRFHFWRSDSTSLDTAIVVR